MRCLRDQSIFLLPGKYISRKLLLKRSSLTKRGGDYNSDKMVLTWIHDFERMRLHPWTITLLRRSDVGLTIGVGFPYVILWTPAFPFDEVVNQSSFHICLGFEHLLNLESAFITEFRMRSKFGILSRGKLLFVIVEFFRSFECIIVYRSQTTTQMLDTPNSPWPIQKCSQHHCHQHRRDHITYLPLCFQNPIECTLDGVSPLSSSIFSVLILAITAKHSYS